MFDESRLYNMADYILFLGLISNKFHIQHDSYYIISNYGVGGFLNSNLFKLAMLVRNLVRLWEHGRWHTE